MTAWRLIFFKQQMKAGFSLGEVLYLSNYQLQHCVPEGMKCQ